jgi:hypothetical protein
MTYEITAIQETSRPRLTLARIGLNAALGSANRLTTDQYKTYIGLHAQHTTDQIVAAFAPSQTVHEPRQTAIRESFARDKITSDARRGSRALQERATCVLAGLVTMAVAIGAGALVGDHLYNPKPPERPPIERSYGAPHDIQMDSDILVISPHPAVNYQPHTTA